MHPSRVTPVVVPCSGCDQVLMPGDRVQAADDGAGAWGECCGEWRPIMSARRITPAEPAPDERCERYTNPPAPVTLPGQMGNHSVGGETAPTHPASDLNSAVAQLASAAAVLQHASTRRVDVDPLVSAVVIGLASWLDDLACRTEARLRTASARDERVSITAPGTETYVGLLVANAVLSTSTHSRS